jgi:sugar lactone lactonase YvrE
MHRLILFLAMVGISGYANSQIIATVAGNGFNGNTGDHGPATNARISPYNCAFDQFGTFYISEYGSQEIRKVDSFGIITTIAGTGLVGYGGDGGPATNAKFQNPDGLACDSLGNLYISDRQNYRIRKIDVTTGIITTYAGSGVIGSSGDGGPATAADIFPTEICFDKSFNLYISDNTYHKIRMVNATTGIITTYAGTGVSGFSGDGGPATIAKLNSPGGIVFDSNGSLFISDAQNKRIRKVDTSGIITTIAGTGVAVFDGDGRTATATNIGPLTLTIDIENNLYFSDSTERIREIDASGFVHTIAGTGLLGYSGDGGPATAAEIFGPEGVAVDICGSVYFSDNNNYRIRKITEPPTLATPTIILAGSTTGTVGTTVTVYATVSSAGSSYVIYWMDDGVVFTSTTVPYVTYTKAAGTDTITARIVPTGYGCWDSTTSAPHIVGMSSEGLSPALSEGKGAIVYPNPAHGSVQVISNTNISELTISNIPGQMVREKRCATTHEQMDVNGLSPGLYLLCITDEYGTVHVVKLMVGD